jgi:hypothetical protein
MHKGEGFSRDIGSHGVYVCAEWRAQLQRDVDIDVDILLPAFSKAQRVLHMSGRAKIIRVEPTATDEHSRGLCSRERLLRIAGRTDTVRREILQHVG